MNPALLNRQYSEKLSELSDDELNTLAGYVKRFGVKYPIVGRLKPGEVQMQAPSPQSASAASTPNSRL